MGNNVDRVPLLGTVYSGSDYPRLYDAILRGLRVPFGEQYDDLIRTPQGVMLTDIAAYGLRHVALGLDYAAADAFLSTAVTIAAARRHAAQLNVAIPFATSASSDRACYSSTPE